MLVALELVLREEATDAQLGMRSVSMPGWGFGGVRLTAERAISSMCSAEIGNQSTKCVNIFSAHVQINHSFTHFDNCVSV